MSEAHKPKTRRSKAWSKRTVFGTHSHLLLAMLYRYGAADRVQLSRMAGISEDAVKRQLRHLRNSRLLAVAEDMDGRTKGRPRSIYHLTASGVQAGARNLGIENAPAARDHYSRVDVPRSAAHRLWANEYLLALSEAAAGSDIEMPSEEVWSESCPSFPLFGSRRLTDEQKLAAAEKKRGIKPQWLRIAPDGTFVLSFAELPAEQRYYYEYETDLRETAVKDKARRYLSRWRRMLYPDNDAELRWHDPATRLEPLVIITREAKHAERLREALFSTLKEAESWEPLVEALGARAAGTVDPRQLILLGAREQVIGDPLGRIYWPCREYPANLGGWKVGLADAAAVAARITPPEAQEVKKRLKTESEARETAVEEAKKSKKEAS